MRTLLVLLGIVNLQVLTQAQGLEPRSRESQTRPAADVPAADFYIAPNGDDSWSGRRISPTGDRGDGPFRSLWRARDAVRQSKRDAGPPRNGITVEIAPGVYTLAESLLFTGDDSGSPGSPVTYRASRGGAHVVGGRTVDGFKAVEDAAVRGRLGDAAADAVVELHLPSAGVADFGHLARSGFSRSEPLSHLELFWGGMPMRLAQWPNRQWAIIAAVPKGRRIVDGSGKTRGTAGDRFHYSGDRPRRWKSLDDVWVHGYWFVDWADQYLKLSTIDTASRSVVIEPPQSGYGYKKGQRFRFLNVLEELDEPGEYYLDRNTGKLYVWPPAAIEPGAATVSLLREPLIRLRDASHVHFVGLTFESGRSDGIVIEAGQGVVAAGCEIRNMGGAGVRVKGGRHHRIQSCDLHHLGDGGIFLEGGDRRTLTAANHVVDNNHIHHFSRWVRTYRLGVRLSGVGLRASHNFIHDAPHCGIGYNGNDHLIDFNELANLCLDTGDVGGIYTGRDWSGRGTKICFNHIHHLGGVKMGSNAIYLDDLASGQTIRGNVIHHVWRAMMIGGGRDNLVENNIFTDYRIGIHFDARGTGWSGKLIEGRQGGWDMYGRLESVPYDRPPYSTKYPELPGILSEKPLEPKDNRIVGNIFDGGQWLDARGFTRRQAEERGWARFENNLLDAGPNFVDRNAADYRLLSDAPARDIGFEDIPMERIGLQVDEFRKTTPRQEP